MTKPSDMPLVDVAALPDQYGAIVYDRCWFPILAEGDGLIFSKTEPVQPGDFVSIILRPGCFPPGDGQTLVKRYLGPGEVFDEQVIWCDMINPQVNFPVPRRVIQALHRATAIIKACDGPAAKPQLLSPSEIKQRMTVAAAVKASDGESVAPESMLRPSRLQALSRIARRALTPFWCRQAR